MTLLSERGFIWATRSIVSNLPDPVRLWSPIGTWRPGSRDRSWNQEKKNFKEIREGTFERIIQYSRSSSDIHKVTGTKVRGPQRRSRLQERVFRDDEFGELPFWAADRPAQITWHSHPLTAKKGEKYFQYGTRNICSKKKCCLHWWDQCFPLQRPCIPLFFLGVYNNVPCTASRMRRTWKNSPRGCQLPTREQRIRSVNQSINQSKQSINQSINRINQSINRINQSIKSINQINQSINRINQSIETVTSDYTLEQQRSESVFHWSDTVGSRQFFLAIKPHLFVLQ